MVVVEVFVNHWKDMTMTMAHKVSELYSSVLCHSDGTPVECVIADTTIGGVAEAAMAVKNSVTVEWVWYSP